MKKLEMCYFLRNSCINWKDKKNLSKCKSTNPTWIDSSTKNITSLKECQTQKINFPLKVLQA